MRTEASADISRSPIIESDQEHVGLYKDKALDGSYREHKNKKHAARNKTEKETYEKSQRGKSSSTVSRSMSQNRSNKTVVALRLDYTTRAASSSGAQAARRFPLAVGRGSTCIQIPRVSALALSVSA